MFAGIIAAIIAGTGAFVAVNMHEGIHTEEMSAWD